MSNSENSFRIYKTRKLGVDFCTEEETSDRQGKDVREANGVMNQMEKTR